MHQVRERFRIDAQPHHAGREQNQNQQFAPVDIAQLGHVVIGDFAEVKFLNLLPDPEAFLKERFSISM